MFNQAFFKKIFVKSKKIERAKYTDLSDLLFNYGLNKNTLVGLPGVEPGTSPLSGVRSNLLSYRPNKKEAIEVVKKVPTTESFVKATCYRLPARRDRPKIGGATCPSKIGKTKVLINGHKSALHL